MTRIRSISMLTAAAALAVATTGTPAGAQTTDAHIQDLIRQAVASIGAGGA